MSTLRISNEYENSPYFITLTVIEWINIFTRPEYFQVFINSLKYCRKNKGLLLYEFVFMTNHIHLIVQVKEGYKLSQIISDFKKHTTREISKLLEKDNRKYILNLVNNSYSKKKGYSNQIWQRENYPEIIETEKFMNQKIIYIYNNPVVAEYVENPEDWLYSSARNRILGDDGIITLDNIER